MRSVSIGTSVRDACNARLLLKPRQPRPSFRSGPQPGVGLTELWRGTVS